MLLKVWVLFALHRWLHLSQVTIPSRLFNEEMEGPGDRVTIRQASPDERRGRAVPFEESCRYIDEMSYSQQASEIGVRLDGHALQVCHRPPFVLGAATLRKKR